MNVFEDLIEELKEENLLEETVMDTKGREHFFAPTDFRAQANRPLAPSSNPEGGLSRFEEQGAPGEASFAPTINPIQHTPDIAFGPSAITETVPSEPAVQPLSSLSDLPEAFAEIGQPAPSDPVKTFGADDSDLPSVSGQSPTAFDVQPPRPAGIAQPPMPVLPMNPSPAGRTSFASNPRSSFGSADKRPIVNHKEYFKKRAIDEVTGLQMVDHVLSGVEREQMKIVPKPFNDIPVKKALHDFMQVSGDTRSAEHSRAEFQLMQETESWYSSLSHRDRHVSVAHLRRYCETTKPALSPQALIAMGRFYRNSPFSEPVRNKFDLVLTRLFSADTEDEKRELMFPREELIAQLKDLYADWSSIQVYNAADDDSEVLIAVLKFQDFINEAESTATFDELIGSDFFNRLRMLKEGCQENFFAPLITVASIEANIKIGNRYVDLIKAERNGVNAVALEEKYGFLHDQAISDSTVKTFQLVDLLKERVQAVEASNLVEVHVKAEEPRQRKQIRTQTNRLWAVNKWLLGLTIFAVLACVGVYFWAEAKTQEVAGAQSPKVKKVNIENSSLKEVLQSARINEETFFGVALNTWSDLPLERKEETLKKILSIGPEKGFKRVHLLNEKGRAVGFASEEKVEVYNP
ncbi:MAG: hypothetical protein IPN69_13330 [Acidobacteria bacterium]|nr:hypothetical protein [Acidobacteriota bacterium]